MLVLAGQLQRLAQMRAILVAVKAGLVGGNLEQHTAGRAKIDRIEIVAIDHRRHLIPRLKQGLAHLQLPRAILDSKSDVVHRSRR